MLRAASDCCRLGCSTSWRFRAKLLTHADSDRFAHPRFRAHTQPNSYRDSKGPDTYQSEPYSKSNSNSDRNSDPNAAGLSRSKCHPDTNASSCVPLIFWR